MSDPIADHGHDGDWSWRRGAGWILFDERNRYSVSRLQLVVWNTILLSAYATAVMSNLAASLLGPACSGAACGDPLLVKIPAERWILAGITNTSGLVAPLLLRRLHPEETVAPATGLTVDNPDAKTPAVKPNVDDARVGDLSESGKPMCKQQIYRVFKRYLHDPAGGRIRADGLSLVFRLIHSRPAFTKKSFFWLGGVWRGSTWRRRSI